MDFKDLSRKVKEKSKIFSFVAKDAQSGGPVAARIMMLACVFVYLIEVILNIVSRDAYGNTIRYGAVNYINTPTHPYSLLTSVFMHDLNPMHLICNMFTLLAVAPPLEKMLGHARFLALYLISGIGGNIFYLVFGDVLFRLKPESLAQSAFEYALSFSVGASGAIFGLFGALLVVYRRLGIDMRSMVVFVAINFSLPIFMKNISWQCHLGGFIFGGLYIWLILIGFKPLRRKSLTFRSTVYGIFLAVIMLVIFMIIYAYHKS